MKMRTPVHRALAAFLMVALPGMAAAAPATVTGAGGGPFGEGASYAGLALTGQRFGIGLDLPGDGTARGDVQVTLLAAPLPGAPARVVVEGTPTSGTSGNGQAVISGTSTVTIAGGTPQPDVPFTLTLGQDASGRPTVGLALGGTALPAVPVTEGRVTVR